VGIRDLRPQGETIPWSNVADVKYNIHSHSGYVSSALLRVTTKDGRTVTVNIGGLDKDVGFILGAIDEIMRRVRPESGGAPPAPRRPPSDIIMASALLALGIVCAVLGSRGGLGKNSAELIVIGFLTALGGATWLLCLIASAFYGMVFRSHREADGHVGDRYPTGKN
jgi:hypothetical protein